MFSSQKKVIATSAFVGVPLITSAILLATNSNYRLPTVLTAGATLSFALAAISPKIRASNAKALATSLSGMVLSFWGAGKYYQAMNSDSNACNTGIVSELTFLFALGAFFYPIVSACYLYHVYQAQGERTTTGNPTVQSESSGLTTPLCSNPSACRSSYTS